MTIIHIPFQEVLVIRRTYIIFSLFPFLLFGQAQKIPLEEALTKAAIHHSCAIVYNVDDIPQQDVCLNETMSLKKQLSIWLKETDLSFEIDHGQILISKVNLLYGFILDNETSERLISATVFIPETGQYAVTDNQGYFHLKTKIDSGTVEISHLGFDRKYLLLTNLVFNQIQTIGLDQNLLLQTILVNDKSVNPILDKIEQRSKSNLLLDKSQMASVIGGEADILQSIHRQPGVTSGADGIGGIHVRGGKTDQNMIMYEGVKFQNATHALGMFSIFNSSILSKAEFSTSGVNSHHNGHLSSILNVQIKEPSLKSIEAEVQVSSIATQANLELPIIKEKLGILISGRRTHLDPFIKKWSRNSKIKNDESGETNYSFYDFNAKAKWRPNDRSKLTVSIYQGKDTYRDSSLSSEYYFIDDYYRELVNNNGSWKNQFISTHWTQAIKSNHFLNLHASLYNYEYLSRMVYYTEDVSPFFGNDYFLTTLNFKNKINNQSAGIKLDSRYGKHILRYGINLSHKSYYPDQTRNFFKESTTPFPVDDSDVDSAEVYIIERFTMDEYAFHFSDQFNANDKLNINFGLHFNRYVTHDPYFDDKAKFNLWSGFFGLNYIVSPDLAFGANVSKSIQAEHLLTNSDAGFPSDIWMPSTLFSKPQEAVQVETQIMYKLGTNLFTINAYLKKQKNLLFYADNTPLPSLLTLDPTNWELDVEIGNSFGSGLEFLYKNNITSNNQIELTYAYTSTNYDFSGVNGGEKFPFSYSVPHSLNFKYEYRFGKTWKAHVDWNYSSPRPYSLFRHSIRFSPWVNIGDAVEDRVSSTNGSELPAVHSLNISLSKQWSAKYFTHSVTLGVQNLYNRKNVVYQYELEGEGVQKQYAFPIFPILNYTMKL